MSLFNLSNNLSLLRGPLAFLFLQENTNLRLLAILLAVLSDYLDGFLARWRGTSSHFGAILDPLMDRFFVFIAATILLYENQMTLFQVSSLISRDIFLFFLGSYISWNKCWNHYDYRATFFGKITTSLQFFTLLAICLQYPIKTIFYSFFIILGFLTTLEILKRKKPLQAPLDKKENISPSSLAA